MFGKVALSVLSLVLVLALLEGGARLLGFETRARRIRGFSWAERGELYTLPPSTSWRPMPGAPTVVRTNSLGLRGPEIGDKAEGVPRVVFLGDSVTYGFAVPEEAGYVGLVGRELEIEAINAAVPGWCQRQHRLFIEKYGEKLDPDLFVVGLVLNDISELEVGVTELEFSLRSANVLSQLSTRSAFVAAVMDVIAGGHYHLETVAPHMQALLHRPDSPEVRASMERAKGELSQVFSASRAQGREIALVIFPLMKQLRRPGLDAVNRELEDFARGEGIPVLNLLPQMEGTHAKKVFRDLVHLSAEGHRYVSGLISRWLAEQGLVDEARGAASLGANAERARPTVVLAIADDPG